MSSVVCFEPHVANNHRANYGRSWNSLAPLMEQIQLCLN